MQIDNPCLFSFHHAETQSHLKRRLELTAIVRCWYGAALNLALHPENRIGVLTGPRHPKSDTSQFPNSHVSVTHKSRESHP